MIIAVDFDGTLCELCYPSIGSPNMALITMLIQKKKAGDKIILWTCREDAFLEDAVNWCRNYGLEFDAVNDNVEEITALYNHNSRKITADIYIDDKATLPEVMICKMKNAKSA